MTVSRIIWPLVVLLLLNGCANLTSIHRKDSLSDKKATVILSDAKQRAIVAVPRQSGSTEENAIWRVCSEPPPDVFSALAASLAGEASFADGGDPASKEVAAKLSASLSENASTIKRTQTINILRESMFRTCERYLSDAIGAAEFIVQSARDQRAMVAVLAIEQLTGVQEAQAVALTTSASGTAGPASAEALTALAKARQDAQDARAKAEKLREEADSSAPENVTCEAAKASADAANDAKKKLCLAADQAGADQKDADEYFDTIKDGVERLSSASTQAGGTSHSSALSGSAASVGIADRVVQIVKEVANFDELGMTCVVIFRLMADDKDKFDQVDQRVADACIGRIEGKLKLEEAQFKLEAKELEKRTAAIRAQMTTQISQQAKAVWNFIAPNNTPDSNKLDQLITKAQIAVRPRVRRQLLESPDLATFAQRYALLGPDNEKKLADATR